MFRMLIGSGTSFVFGVFTFVGKDWVIGVVGIAAGLAFGLTGIYQYISNSNLKSVRDSMTTSLAVLADVQRSVRASYQGTIEECARLREQLKSETRDLDETRAQLRHMEIISGCACINRGPDGLPACLADPEKEV